MANQQDVSAGQTGNGERGSSGLAARTHDAAEQMKNAASGQIAQAKQRAESAKDQAAERIRRVAMELRHVGETLQTDDEFAARLAQRTSSGIDKVAGYISSADLRQLRNDAESYARKQPAVFFGGAFLLGLAVGRFFKSSAVSADAGSERSTMPGVGSSASAPLGSAPLGSWRSNAPRVETPNPGQKGFTP